GRRILSLPASFPPGQDGTPEGLARSVCSDRTDRSDPGVLDGRYAAAGRGALLADFEPKGAAAKRFGAYRQQDGVAERALFVLDENGVVTWSYCSPIAVDAGAEGILDALDRMLEAGSGGKGEEPWCC